MEADLINRVLAGHGVKAYTYHTNVRTKRPMIAVTPAWTIYGIDRYAEGVKLSAVESLLPEIEHELKLKRDTDVSLRFGRKPFSLLVPNPEPKAIAFRMGLIDNLPAYSAPLGRSYDFFKPNDHNIDFASPDQSNLLIAGMNGSGKSTALRVLVSALAWNNSPERVQFVMCDLKNRGLVPFRSLPHTRLWTADPAESAKAVKWVYDELGRRKAMTETSSLPHLFLILEEMSLLALDGAKDVIANWLPHIAIAGRELGIHVILTSQKPDAGLIGSQLKSQMNVRLVGKLDSATTSYFTTGQEQAHAHKLPGFGAFLLINGRAESGQTTAEPTNVLGFWMDTAACRQLTVDCRVKWGKGMESIDLSTVRSDIDMVMLRNYELAKPVLAEHYDPATGKLKRGGKKLLIEAVFGEGAVTGGSNDKVADAIVAHHGGQKNANG